MLVYKLQESHWCRPQFMRKLMMKCRTTKRNIPMVFVRGDGVILVSPLCVLVSNVKNPTIGFVCDRFEADRRYKGPRLVNIIQGY